MFQGQTQCLKGRLHRPPKANYFNIAKYIRYNASVFKRLHFQQPKGISSWTSHPYLTYGD